MILLKESIANHNAEKVKETIKKFYQSADLDHENYVLPEELLVAAIARTQFFHRGVYALLLEHFAPTSFAYSFSLIHIETINTMIKPEDLFISLVGK